jgi:hypothetical protein
VDTVGSRWWAVKSVGLGRIQYHEGPAWLPGAGRACRYDTNISLSNSGLNSRIFSRFAFPGFVEFAKWHMPNFYLNIIHGLEPLFAGPCLSIPFEVWKSRLYGGILAFTRSLQVSVSLKGVF